MNDGELIEEYEDAEFEDEEEYDEDEELGTDEEDEEEFDGQVEDGECFRSRMQLSLFYALIIRKSRCYS